MSHIRKNRFLLLWLCVSLLLLAACNSEDDGNGGDPDIPQYIPPDRPYQPVDGDQNTDTNRTGNSCTGTCADGQYVCIYPVSNTTCDGLCLVKGGQTDGACAGDCTTGEGCPDDHYCLECPNMPDIAGNCVPVADRTWFNNRCGIEEPDGDNVTPDGDSGGDEDEDQGSVIPTGRCEDDRNCLPNQHCDPYNSKCAPECDPFNPECQDGNICHVIDEGDNSSKGIGICVAPTGSGREDGQFCYGSQLCQRDLICILNDHCGTVCNPQSEENTCSDGKVCIFDGDSGVGGCARCSDRILCPEGYVCKDSKCEEKILCDTYEDCTQPLTCLSGYCQDGCRINGCSTGLCNGTTGYCETFCTPACSDGECCNSGTCGPCCEPPCAPMEVCTEDPSCSPSSPCCIEKEDCREQVAPDAWCEGDLVCDMTTGDCRPECPSGGCQWGYTCGALTGYSCQPMPQEGCDPLTACADPCMICHMLQAQCVPTATCPIQCIPEGVSCAASYGDMFCCAGTTCKIGAGDMYTCQP